jgi:hypothetical protein
VFRHKDGSPIPVLLNADVIEFNGQNDVLLTSIRDISNLKLVEEELIRERRFFQCYPECRGDIDRGSGP